MSNTVTTQILTDGARSATVKAVGVLDSSDLTATTIADPADFSPTPTKFRIDAAKFSVDSPLDLRVWWDATSDVLAATLAGTQSLKFRKFGGLINNAGSGVTGKIQVTTTGYSSGTVNFTLVLELVKMGI